MDELSKTLAALGEVLPGTSCGTECLRALPTVLDDDELRALKHLHQDLPIYAASAAFSSDSSGNVYPEDAARCIDGLNPQPRAFEWVTPQQLAEIYEEGSPEQKALEYGYFLIGLCAYGGDPYFIRLRPRGNTDKALYCIDYDWLLQESPDESKFAYVVAKNARDAFAVATWIRGHGDVVP